MAGRRQLLIGVAIPRDWQYPNYFNALEALGARGIRTDDEAEFARCDGLLIPGGADICPDLYGQENNGSEGCDRELDLMQLNALDWFYRAGKPVFGICRGHQVINVYFEGTLIQNLPTWETHKWEEATERDRAHETEAVPGSWIADIYGTRFFTNSAHHQGVDRPGKGLIIDQRAPDGVVEAMHHESAPVWCVQWHPERMCYAHRREDTVDGSLVLSRFLDRCGGD